jgi:centrin-1
MKRSGVQTTFNPSKFVRNGLSEDIVMEIKEAFDNYDTDKSGSISINELKDALLGMGIDAKASTLVAMMNEIDKDKSGTIDFEEFFNVITFQMGDSDSREDLWKVFHLFLGPDAGQKNPKISFQHLKRAFREIHEEITDEELMDLIGKADLDRDGGVDFEEFYAFMTKRV